MDVALLPPPNATAKRADLLSLKVRLATILPPEEGQLYWATLVKFCSGKINREELGIVLDKVMKHDREALQLHNALLLSILYNTTRPTQPPSSLRHIGWHKRARDKEGNKIPDPDPKKRKLKASIMAIGKRERAEIKALGGALKVKSGEEGGSGLLGDEFDSRGGKFAKDGIPLALGDSREVSEALRQEYMRCLQAPLCCESRSLPDVDTLQDRMSLLAYESGIAEGADSTVALLGVQAVETHLRTMIKSVLTLIRFNRAAGIDTTTAHQLSILAQISDPESLFSPPKIIVSSESDSTLPTVPIASTSRLEQPEDADRPPPISVMDFASLFEISPHLLVQQHVAAVEKMYALPPPSDDSSSSESEAEDPKPAVEGSPAAASAPAIEGRPRSKSRSGRSKSISTGTGREKYLIDPSATYIPTGHPEIASHPLTGGLSPRIERSTKFLSRANSMVVDGRGGEKVLSPSSVLQAQLFPEATPTASAAPTPQVIVEPPTGKNDTSTDGGTDTEDEPNAGGMGIVRNPGGRSNAKNGRGRKLYDVVDTNGLLHDVLG